jgi:hypothetical protein
VHERCADALAETLVSEEQEIIDRASEDDEWSDHTSLRREEQRLARVADAQRLDVVRDHGLEVRARIGAADGDVVARASCDAESSAGHPD